MRKIKRAKWGVASAIVIGVIGASCGEDGGGFSGEIQFEGQQAFLPGFEQDTGFLPAESPAAIRIVARGEGGVVAKARATTDGSSLTPVAGSGELSSNGELLLEVSARINTAGFEFEGVVDSFSYVIEPATTTFEPFLLDSSASVEAALPASEVARVPVPSVPGATLIVDVTGGTLSTSFQGVCAETAEGVGQYTGATTTTGVVELGGTIEIDIPIVGTETFGPFPFSIDIPQLASEVDLGSRSLETAEPVEGAMPCDGTVGGTGGPVSGDPDSGPGSGPGPTTDPGTSSSAGPTTDPTTTTMGTVDDTGMTTTMGDTMGDTTGMGGDPNYPNPDDGACPAGTDAVESSDMSSQFCAPVCAGDICPEGDTGDAFPSCVLSPLSSFGTCMFDEDCEPGETCDVDTCVIMPPTHCALLCDFGETCPDGMSCFGDFLCAYPN